MTNCLSCVTNPFFSIFSTKKVIRFTSRYRCASLFLHWVAAGGSHNKPALCSSVLEQDTAALTSRCSFWLLTLTARWREGAPLSRQQPYFSFGGSIQKEKKQQSVILSLLSASAQAEPLEGAAALRIAPQEPRQGVETRLIFTRSPTHTWAQRAMVQRGYNVQSSSSVSKLPSVNLSNLEKTLLQTKEVLHFFKKILLSEAFHSREKTRHSSSQIYRRPRNHMQILEPAFFPHSPHLAFHLAALSLPPHFPSARPSLPPLLFLPTFGNAPLKHVRVSCCCKSGMQTQNTGER